MFNSESKKNFYSFLLDLQNDIISHSFSFLGNFLVEELMTPPDGVKRKLDGLETVFHLKRVVKCLMEGWLMNNGMKMTVKTC